MSEGACGPDEDALRQAAADWFARMRGPGAHGAIDGFKAWYAVPANAAAYDKLVRRWEQSAFLPNAPLDRRARLARLGRAPEPRRFLVGGAVALVLLLAGGIYLVPRALDRGAATPVANDRQVAAQLRLADDSQVSLQPGAALAPVGRDARHYRLMRGAARFEVAHDPAHPFSVEGGPVRVIARGTIFDISLADGEAEVGLTRGAVDVEITGQTGSRATVRLSPGERIHVSPDGQVTPVATPVAVTGGRLAFADATLDTAARAFGTTAPRIWVADPGTAARRITGTFAAGDSRAFASAAASLFQLSVTSRPDGSLLIGPAQK